MTVTAVVCAYWPTRFDNVERIVADLQAGSVTPERIIVLNNNPSEPARFDRLRGGPVEVICAENTECRGKFVTGLYRPADFYLLADDDTTVGARTLECLVRHADPGFVTGYWGVTLREGSFMNGTIVGGGNVMSPMRVDAFHGRILFMAHDALVRMFDAEATVRLANPGMDYVGDDILAGLANPGSVVIPMRGDECFVDLDQGGVAMCARDGYFAERDQFTRAALAALEAV